jgi:prevent-host-death family protein
MQYISATVEKAQREPVMVRKKNRDVAVVLSVQDYERMRKADIKEFQEFRKNIGLTAEQQGLTEAKLNEILAEEG